MRLPRIRLPRKVTQKIGEIVFKVGRKKPELCLITGIALGGGALIMTVVETWNGKDQIEKDVDAIKSLQEYDPVDCVPEETNYPMVKTEADKKKQLRKFYTKTGFDIFKIYWKPLVMGGTSLVLIVTSHKMLRRSLAEMAAMYAGLLESYKQLGMEKGAQRVEEIEAIDAETGEIVKKPVASGKPYHSPYAVWYDEGVFDDDTGKWIWKNPLYRNAKGEFEVLIRSVQNECNDILRMRGYMFLNEVRSKLGLPPVKEGQHLGWVRNGLLNGKGGDDYIDFGVFPEFMNGKYQLPVNKAFLDPKSNQRIPLIDFNCTCIDPIFDDIYEYHNQSYVSFDKRRLQMTGLPGSKEHLDRWFMHNELTGEG